MTGKPVEGLKVRKYNAKEAKTGYLLVLPAILGFLFFCVMPILYSAVLSFTDWNVLKPAKFIGLKNYIKLLTGDRQFASAIQATFSYAISSTIFSSLYAFLLATKSGGSRSFERFFIFLRSFRRSLTRCFGSGCTIRSLACSTRC